MTQRYRDGKLITFLPGLAQETKKFSLPLVLFTKDDKTVRLLGHTASTLTLVIENKYVGVKETFTSNEEKKVDLTSDNGGPDSLTFKAKACGTFTTSVQLEKEYCEEGISNGSCAVLH